MAGDERLTVTDAGREHLRRQMWGTRGEVQHLFTGGGVHGQGPFDFAQDKRYAGVGADGKLERTQERRCWNSGVCRVMNFRLEGTLRLSQARHTFGDELLLPPTGFDV